MTIPTLVAGAPAPGATAWLLREDRPNPDLDLVARADAATKTVEGLFARAEIFHFDVFAADLAVVGPANLAKVLPLGALSRFTDVVLDLSSLSLGMAYPLAAILYEAASRGEFQNYHLMLAADPEIDRVIKYSHSDRPHSPRGFARRNIGRAPASVMWMPQVQYGQGDMLETIAVDVKADDICPILPFPTRRLRDADNLIVEYGEQLREWQVDPRDIVYAAEDDPLDVYRIIVRMAREREQVFGDIGSSEVVLSPIGGKAVAMGSLMAALELGLSVRYIEALEYEPLPAYLLQSGRPHDTMAVWLNGGPAWDPET